MTSPTLRGGLRAALACLAICAAAPAAASASTWTVDDDKAQCPNASFTSIQAAVNQAAPWDTILVCDGLYQEQSTPIAHSQSPATANSKNGLTITKPLTIKGTGASKVTIQPAPSLTTLAGDTPQLRDGGGNVVTISRQSLGSSDSNENFVDISGVTISSPNTYAEAGVAFFNTGGRISNSTVGPLKRVTASADLAGSPLGYGVVVTNSLIGSSTGAVRRQVDVVNSLVTGYQTGGVLFDAATAAAPTTRSGIQIYGNVTGSRVVGSGQQALYPQNGVEYHSGARGVVSGSEIANNRFSTTPRQSVGLLLTDAETGDDPANPGTRGFAMRSSSITGNGYGAFNANAANDAVREGAPASLTDTWWGCAAGPIVGGPSNFTQGNPLNGCQGISGNDAAATPAPSIELGTPKTAAPAALTVPALQPDARPTGSLISDPVVIAPGEAFTTWAAAADDFGVKRVQLLLNGTVIATDTTAPYELTPTWKPTADDAGRTFDLAVLVTDSSGQQTTSAVQPLKVTGAVVEQFAADATAWDAGAVTVGQSATRTITLSNTGTTSRKLTSVAVTGGFAVTGGTCAADAIVAAGAACTVVLTYAPGAPGASSGALTVATTQGASVVVALSGTGVAPVVPAPPAPVPAAPAASTTPAPAPAPLPPTTGGASTATVVKSVGPLTATLNKRPTASLTTGSLSLGRLKCATGRSCEVDIAGVLKLGKKRYAIELTRTLRSGATSPVTLRLPKAARTALRKAKKGTLVVTLAVGDDIVGTTMSLTGR